MHVEHAYTKLGTDPFSLGRLLVMDKTSWTEADIHKILTIRSERY